MWFRKIPDTPTGREARNTSLRSKEASFLQGRPHKSPVFNTFTKPTTQKAGFLGDTPRQAGL